MGFCSLRHSWFDALPQLVIPARVTTFTCRAASCSAPVFVSTTIHKAYTRPVYMFGVTRGGNQLAFHAISNFRHVICIYCHVDLCVRAVLVGEEVETRLFFYAQSVIRQRTFKADAFIRTPSSNK